MLRYNSISLKHFSTGFSQYRQASGRCAATTCEMRYSSAMNKRKRFLVTGVAGARLSPRDAAFGAIPSTGVARPVFSFRAGVAEWRSGYFAAWETPYAALASGEGSAPPWDSWGCWHASFFALRLR